MPNMLSPRLARSAFRTIRSIRMLSTRVNDILTRLDIQPGNEIAGLYDGTNWKHGSGDALVSREAATGETLATIRSASLLSLQHTISSQLS